MEKHLCNMQPLLDSYDGWSLHPSVQTGVSAMLAGDFTRALSNFTRAPMHVLYQGLPFARDALAKTALIYACFGNASTARSRVRTPIEYRGPPVGSKTILTHPGISPTFWSRLKITRTI